MMGTAEVLREAFQGMVDEMSGRMQRAAARWHQADQRLADISPGARTGDVVAQEERKKQAAILDEAWGDAFQAASAFIAENQGWKHFERAVGRWEAAAKRLIGLLAGCDACGRLDVHDFQLRRDGTCFCARCSQSMSKVA
jgi:hypothetical protein